MLIGAHVSTAGGLVEAHRRGVEIGADAIQVFNQNPRQWRPTKWRPDDIAEFNELMRNGRIGSVVIHTVYLINCASRDKEFQKKSLVSLVHALRLGDAINSDGVVLHPGSAVGEPLAAALERASPMIRTALGETDRCTLLLENTAGAGDTLGRTFEELGELLDGGGGKRLGVCLDCCHMLASGFDITTADKLEQVMDDYDRIVGLDRLGAIHVNDSKTKLGSNSDRHAPLGTGELGARGCAAFLSEPRFEGLPAIFEGPGVAGKAPTAEDLKRMRELRRNGKRSRKRRK